MITPQQAAESLQVSTSTLRRWASDFEPFLSRRKGVKRSYLVSDLATFGRIKELYKQGLTTRGVIEALPVAQAQAAPGSQGSQALITLSDFAQGLEFLQVNNAKLQREIDEQAAKIQALQLQVEKLAMPWYKRLFGAPKTPQKSD